MNLKLPHWLQIALGLAVLIVAYLINEQSKGDLALPAAAVAVLTVLKTVLGVLSDSAMAKPPSDPPAPTASKPKLVSSAGFAHVRALFVLTGLCFGLAVFTHTACKQGQIVINNITPAAACVIDDLFAGKNAGQIVQDCAGVTMQDVLGIIEQLLACEPDAGPPLSAAHKTHLLAVKAEIIAKDGGP